MLTFLRQGLCWPRLFFMGVVLSLVKSGWMSENQHSVSIDKVFMALFFVIVINAVIGI